MKTFKGVLFALCVELLAVLTIAGATQAQDLSTVNKNGIDFLNPNKPFLSLDVQKFGEERRANRFPGVDIGAKVNAAYADCPAAGCVIRVSAGWYDYTTPIVMTTTSKAVTLECDGDVQAATVLHYYATSGTAVEMANGAGLKIRGCQIKGPSTGTPVGVYIHDAVLGGMEASDVSYFATGLKFGANTYVETFTRVMIHDNTQNILVPTGLSNFGENIAFIGSDIYQPAATAMTQSCISIGSGVFTFSSSSIDQCGVTIDGTNSGVTVLGGHFEASNTILPYVKMAAGCNPCTFHSFGAKWWENGNNTGRTEFVMNASTQTNVDNEVLIVGGSIATGGETVAQFINSTHGCCSVGSVFGLQIGASGGTISAPIGGNWANGYSYIDKGKAFHSNGLTLPNIKSTTGNRYVCVSTTGALISQAAACSGT